MKLKSEQNHWIVFNIINLLMEVIKMSKEQDLREQLRHKWEEMENVQVKIALLGQPGAGKSSLINALIGKKLFEVGVHTDTTVEAQEENFESLVITDLPGYGTAKFPVETWVKEFKPEDYDLYLFVFEGKLHDSDAELFKYLKKWRDERKHPFFVVRNKTDQIWDEDKKLEELQNEIRKDVIEKIGEPSVKVYFTSCKDKTGLAPLKADIFKSNIAEVKKSKLTAAFKAETMADIDMKREMCLDDVTTYAWAGAANALNPVPGLDISVDVGVFYKMLKNIREAFGFSNEEELKKYEVLGPVAKQLINKILEYATKEGVIQLIKQLGVRYARQKFSKYIPFVGQALAALAGFAMIKEVGTSYVEDCYKLSQLILEKVVKNS